MKTLATVLLTLIITFGLSELIPNGCWVQLLIYTIGIIGMTMLVVRELTVWANKS